MKKILDGKKISDKIIKNISKFTSELEGAPTLAVIQVGNDSISSTYINFKQEKALESGINFNYLKFNADILEQDLIEIITEQNNNDSIDGVIVQLPLPSHIDQTNIVQAIAPWKDVDGLHPLNAGLLTYGEATFMPPTAKGVEKLIKENQINVKGKDVVIIGGGATAGRPISSLFQNMGATVSILNINTKDISKYTKTADIIVTAVGKKNILKPEDVKKGVILFNIGFSKEGKVIHGDYDFELMKNKAKSLTPILGSTGPLTIAYLLKNTIIAYKIKRR